MELYDRSAWTGNDKISGNAPHAHKEVNSHFVHPWNAARQGKDRRGQIANRRSTVGGRWNEKNRPRRLFSCAPLVQGQPLRRLTPPAPLLPKGSLLDSATSQEVALSEPCLLYTSDAADDTPCVDLGGRRIIKKKFFQAEDGIRDSP